MIALNMIVKDDSEAKLLDRCLDSINKYVNGIYITITNKPDKELLEVCEKYNVGVSYFKWNKSFADARNYAMSQIPEGYEYMLWLDADDVFVGGEKIKDALAMMKQQGLKSLYMQYNYDIDEKTGAVNIVHPRERIVKMGDYEWKGSLHETLIYKGEEQKSVLFNAMCVNHYPTQQAKDGNIYRNLEILKAEVEKTKDNVDPRIAYYYGRNLFDVKDFEEADKQFEYHLKTSGWDEERAMSDNYRGLIRLIWQKYDEAEEFFLKAIQEKATYPTWYINLAYTKVLQKKYDEALAFAKIFRDMPQPKTSMVLVPADDEMRYYMVLYLLAIGKKDMVSAIEAAKALTERFPDVEDFKYNLISAERIKELSDVTRSVGTIVSELRKNAEDDKIAGLLNVLPETVQENPYISAIRAEYLPAKIWSEDSVVIFTGKTFEAWSPKSLETGLGGSETAVIQLAREWQKKGKKVTVYGWFGKDEGEYDGVDYFNYWKFNPKDEFNTIISWRNILLLDVDLKAKTVLLDLHDVPFAHEFTKERVDKIDKIFVKSKYHRTLLPDVSDDKFVIIPNGYDPSMEPKDVKRNPKKLIYKSSYDRGLEALLKYGWPKVKAAVPDAELSIFYGWNLFDSIHANNPERQLWKKKMLELMSQDGVKEYGRIGQAELMKETAESLIHYYPCTFEEIDCISVRESAAVGTIPVTTDYAALEGREYCSRTDGDIYLTETHERIADAVIAYLKDNEAVEEAREIFQKKARKESWVNIASKWLPYI